MGWASFRLTQEDKKKLDAMAEKKGMTVSELIRDMIRNGYEQLAVSDATQKIDKLSNDVAKLQKDVARTLQIVTLLGQASPFVSRQLSESSTASPADKGR
jgi:predicted transcriptional regulator